MRIGSDTVSGHVFAEVSDRLAILVEATLKRGRVILHYSLFKDNGYTYGGVIWREED